ncbi:thiolase family protein [Chloroflexota bacterium]
MAKNPNDIVVIDGVRTPMGSFGGTLKDIPAHALGTAAIKAILKRTGLDPDLIDDVMGANTRQAGNGPNPVRTAMRNGGLKPEIPAGTMNCACPSSMKATIQMAQNLMLGDAQLGLVVGFESMSTIPYFIRNIRWGGLRFGDGVIQDGWSDSVDPVVGYGMGMTAENVNEKYQITREEQDEYALGSHQKAAVAQDNGWFDNEVVPVEVPQPKGKPPIIFEKDESIRRDTNMEKMGKLPPSFKEGGTVTAANSCGLTDGGSCLIITTRKRADELGLKPIWKMVSYATAAVDNSTMGEGPGVSIPMALKRAGMTVQDIDVFEINEAFAAQVLSNLRLMDMDLTKVNFHGGAIALGHPTGCSGARIQITGYNVLKRLDKEWLACGICGGGGVTCAMVIQREL